MESLFEQYARVFREAAADAERADAQGVFYVSAIGSIWQSQAKERYSACVACETMFTDLFDSAVAENNLQAILMLSFAAEFYSSEFAHVQ